MFLSIFVVFLYFISLILFSIAFIKLVNKKEGNLKKTILEFIISIFAAIIGCYIQFGFDYFKEFIANRTGGENENFDITDEILDDETEHIHTAYVTRKENFIEPTCVDTGSYESVTYCECGEELERNTFAIEAYGHNYISTISEPTCVECGFTTYICSRCNDTYVDDNIDELGHDYEEGVCIRCGYQDPEYVKVLDDKEIMKILSNSVVSDSGGYVDYLGTESISVFAEDRYNCFSINTAVSYNLWGHEIQNVIFNISEFNKFDILKFDIGGETGSSGSMEVEIFIDKTLDDAPDYTYELEASSIPISVSIDIKNATSLSFRVTNHSNNVNKLVFFNFYIDSK